MVSTFVLLLCFLTIANSEVLPEQADDNIDPIKQTGDESEPGDQSKRTIFDSGNAYGIEKHVRLHPYGYKYLLGYRPVKFQLVPVARPLYVKPSLWRSPNLQFSAKPVVTLLPPKTVPVFKSHNQWKFGKLPVNVPPSVPLRPWQQEGWTPLNKDNKSFVPSVSLPEPETTIVPSRSPVIPIIPTSVVPTAPVFPVAPPPTVFVHQKPVVSIAPVPTLNTVVPVQPPPLLPAPAVPVHPTVHVNPISPVHFEVGGRPLVPINYLPGKLNLPVPDLGVLPLGSTVPVQAHSGFIHKIPPQIFLPNQHILSRLPFPGGVVHQEHVPVIPPVHALSQPVHSLLPQHIHPVFPQSVVHQHAPTVLPQPILPQSVVHQHAPPVLPQPILPQSVLPQHVLPQPVLPQPIQPAFSQPIQPAISQPIYPHHVPEAVPQHTPHFHITSHQFPEGPGQHNIQLPGHNFQFFTQNGQTQFQQETIPNVPQPQQPDQGYHYDPPLQQEVQEPPGFFQPGKTDLQIPGYLPEHPHLRQSFIPSQQDPNIDPLNVK